MTSSSSSNRSAQPLELEAYRRLIALDEPWRAAQLGAAPQAISAIVDALTRDAPLVARQLRASQRSERELMEALLTLRGPEPLEPSIEQLLDGVLSTESRQRGTVEPLALPRLGAGAAWAIGSVLERCALWQGDITILGADAIVNAANSELLGCFVPFHGCIDNAIHARAGPRLRRDCARLREVQGTLEGVGMAKATRGYHLPARYVLHTVGPRIVRALADVQRAQLSSCYRACLELAAKLGARKLAFCAISTGVFRFPKLAAAQLALAAVEQYWERHSDAFDCVVFNVYGDDDRRAYEVAIAERAVALRS